MTTLHIVQPGETVSSIAEKYNLPPEKIETDNVLTPDSRLNVGQSLIIAYPKQIYIVQEGDTLFDIARENNVSIIELVQNNPSILDQDHLDIGQELVLRYEKTDKIIRVNGFTFPYITKSALKKTLPFLTYLTIIGYQVSADGKLDNIDDNWIIKMADNYGVIPVMFVSTMDFQGRGSYEVTHQIFNSLEIQNVLINNILTVLRAKSYYGVNLGFQYIHEEDLNNYGNFIKKISTRLSIEGYELDVSLIPSTFGYEDGVKNNPDLFTTIGQAANNINLLSYQWSFNFIPTTYETTYIYLKNYLELIIPFIPPEKIYVGLTRIAYDWELPYVGDQSYGVSLTTSRALELADQLGVPIYFDDVTQTPFYLYNMANERHLVWYKDARSVNALVNLVFEYNLAGIGIWTVVNYYPTTYLILNSQYNIVKLLPIIYGEE